MSAYPNLTQFFGGAPQPPPDGSVDTGDPSLDFSIPSAYDNPDLWDNPTFQVASNPSETPWKIAPDGMIVVHVKVNPKTKIDKKGGAGKAAPRQSKTGGDVTKVDIKIEAVAEAWPYVLAAVRRMQVGTELIISHPKTSMAQVTKIVIGEWKDAPTFDDKKTHAVTWELPCQEVKASAQSGAGGGNATSTPDASNQQRATYAAPLDQTINNIPALNSPLRTNPNTGSAAAAQSAATLP